MSSENRTKTIVGYCEPLSLRAGESIRLMASRHPCASIALDLVRINCGDPTRSGPGFSEQRIVSALPSRVGLTPQSLATGSFGTVDLTGLSLARSCQIELYVMPTAPDKDQTVISLRSLSGDELALRFNNARIELRWSDGQLFCTERPAVVGRWYCVSITLKYGATQKILTSVSTIQTRSPGRDYFDDLSEQRSESVSGCMPLGCLECCRFATSSAGDTFDGRIARPKLTVDDVQLAWDLAQGIDSRDVIDISEHHRHGELHQLPARGVTGPSWDGTQYDWRRCPDHYDAVHFHSDDLYDAEWPAVVEFTVPSDLPSGIYAFRLGHDGEFDRIPFFVRPAVGTQTSRLALLMPSCTYIAYANHRMLFEGADFVAARARLRPEHEFIRAHPELGPSLYEKHSDGSGVMYSSRRRPVLQLRPGADGWNFTPDTNINAFLRHLDIGHDVLADEDLHDEGVDALSAYKVIVTGSHPEYWSTKMLDALDEWLREGGRLIYLGGNGFYWRVAFNEAWPGAIELRRAEDGVRNWQTLPGESYHSFNGEYGGLWRRLGRAPNELVGVGFAAQGFERAIGYERKAASYESRAAWIFDGVADNEIGTSGLGGGAAGQEVDSYNPTLGSPSHAVVLASATNFGPDMTRTKEELDAAITVPTPDPVVRADVVFFETPHGGAVFSVGSIAWFGALARNGYDNDVARITANVVQRFLSRAPFELPDDELAQKTGVDSDVSSDKK